ncbi:ABC transporter permease [Caballeronia mineralivorans PML1(12)]|uniref:ABC transporter permease n=1 Tax=Caballeronia mineralivorans PML1(12) TaxID=908627 RepID=A0A0J1CMS8_9BURK|nr:ABC transporter permease subunit [Caballeronia mineralivorans]KLU21839.1 ABC transporter permease [Caballeronia mineralivorans PML1(12)]
MNASTIAAGRARPASRGLRPGPLWLALPGVLFLAVFLLYPSLKLLSLSVLKSDGTLSFAAFARFFGPSVYRQVLQTTFAIALETTACCLLFGYPLAYWLAGLSRQRQQIVSLLVLLSFWSSALVKTFAWLVLLGRTGFIAQVLHALGIGGGEHLLFNRTVVVFAIAHTLLPLAVVTMLPVMNQIDRRLSMAASTLGADRAQVFWRVFFASSMRGVAAAGLLVFIGALGFFIAPTLLGSPREMMLGQLIIVQINELQNWQLASALAVVLVLSALVTCLIYDLVFGLSSLADDKRAGHSMRQHHLRRVGIGMVNFLGLVCSFAVSAYDRHLRQVVRVDLLTVYAWLVIAVLLFPILAIVPMAFSADTFLSFPPKGFSLRWFATYFESPLWIGATLRSFGIGVIVTIVTTAVATPAALGIARSGGKLASGLFLLFLLPMIVPSIVIAIALFYFCAHISLVATNLGIVIGHIVIAMPMVFVILLTTFKGHDWGIDHAAATLGANRLQVLRHITLPSIRNGLAAAFVIGFLSSFEELTVALFIGGGIKTTLPKQLWDDILLQVSPTLAAASTVVLCVVTLLFLVLQWVRPSGKVA